MTQLIIIAIYLAALLALGFFASRSFRGTSGDYQLASHSIGPFLLLMSIFGTTMTAFALVGSTGEAFKEGIGVYGMLASSSGIIHSLCFFVIGIKLWSFGKKYGYTTQIQFFRARLENDYIGILLFPILVGLVIPYLLIGVMAAGSVINGVTKGAFKPTPPVALASADTGNPEAARPENTASDKTAKTTTAKPGKKKDDSYLAKYGYGVPNWLASLVICCVVLAYVFFGGMRGTAWANAFQTIVFMILGVVTFYVIAVKLGGDGKPFLESLKTASESVADEKITRSDMSKTKFFTYLLVPLSVGMFPHLFQHWLTAKNAKSFKLPVVAHPIFIMIVWVPCVLVGIWATSDLFLGKIPPPVKGAINGNPNLVLPVMVKFLTNPVLGGFLTAGILAAIMSSLDSQFLCIGTMFTNDIVAHYGGKNRFSDRQILLFSRLFIIAVVIVTYILSLFEPRAVFAMGVWCFSGFSSLFPLIFAAVYWKRLSAAGAFAGVLAAISSWSYLFYDSDSVKTGLILSISQLVEKPIKLCRY